ncbi:MAG: UDP-N-acetylmuramate dehydrogenase [Gammaproteobacteria bacterium]|jgi:UDP-N-acetylmuramate dehydrogenase
MSTDPGRLRGELRRDEPLAGYTSWHAGGNADRFYIPADADDLAEFVAQLPEEEEVTWLGLGSNLLVRDGGVRGTVICVKNVLGDLEEEAGGVIRAGAGVPCAKVARFSVRAGLTGAEFLAGIPGTLGGALAMNAGAFGGETWDIVTEAETMNRRGEHRLHTRADLEVGYRTVNLPSGEWFISARLQLARASDDQGRERIRELLARRSATQPMGEYSCGSVFRNPAGDHAARLIEACGLKGRRLGGARVSEKHANFIINDGTASAADIEALIDLIAATVEREHGIRLQREVRIIGVKN